MSSPSFSRVVRSGLWLYLSSLVNSFSGFIYWLMVSVYGGSGIVGLTSATVALAGVVTGFLSFGEEVGVQRFVGAFRGRGEVEGVSRYFWTTALFRLATYVPAGLAMMGMGLAGLSFGGLSADMLFYGGVMVLLGSVGVFDSLLSSHLVTWPVFLGSVVGNAVRVPLGVVLVASGWGWVGAILGYIILAPVGFIIKLFPSLRLAGFRMVIDLKALKDVLKAGVASWLPSMVAVLGQQVGVLTLFGLRGASETGLYYVAFTVSGVVTGFGGSVLGLMMPVLSGMGDGRKRAVRRAIKNSLALTAPMAFILAVYPGVLLGLLGGEYHNAVSTLTVLAPAIPSTLLSTGITSLLYAYGMYSTVFVLVLAGNLSRIVTYAPFSNQMGGFGIALSYTLGAYAALAAAIPVCRKIGFNPGFREALLITFIPLAPALILHILNVSWMLGGPLLLLLPYTCYLKTGILRRDDLRELAHAIAPAHVVNGIYQRLRPVIDWLID